MGTAFSEKLSVLRKEKGVSQRTVAGELSISQALLSHYEKGIREPGLDFVARACRYYGVTADYLLGLSETPHPAAEERLALLREELKRLNELAENGTAEPQKGC